MTTTIIHPTTFDQPTTIRVFHWPRLLALALITLTAIGLTIPVTLIGIHIHPLAGAAMVPLGALLFVVLVWRANPSKAGR